MTSPTRDAAPPAGPAFVVAGDNVRDAPLSYWAAALRAASALDGDSVAHVGFVWGPSRLLVVLPKAYGAESVRARLATDPAWALSQAFLLMRLLARCRRDSRFRSLHPASEAWIVSSPTSGADLAGALEAAVALRADFLEHGLYWERSPLHRANDPSNPVDWPRTIRSRPPLLDGNEVVWFDTVHRARARDPRDPLHRLHAWAVADVLARTGEPQLAPEGSFLTPGEMAEVAANPQRYLEALLARTYRDRGRYLLRLIRAWLRASSISAAPGARPDPDLLLSRSFEYVWEHVLRDLLDNTGRAGRASPTGVWTPTENRSPQDMGPITPRVDIRRQSDGGALVYLLDAKDKAVLPGRTGSSDDHYKQIIYAQLLDLPDGGHLVNALLFPAVMPGHPVRVLGVHEWPTRLRRSRVVEAALDFERAVKAWLGDAPLDPDTVVTDIRTQADAEAEAESP